MLEYDIKDISAILAVAQLCKDKWGVEEFLSTFTESTEEMVLDVLVEYAMVETKSIQKERFNSKGQWVGYDYSTSYDWV